MVLGASCVDQSKTSDQHKMAAKRVSQRLEKGPVPNHHIVTMLSDAERRSGLLWRVDCFASAFTEAFEKEARVAF